MPVKSIQVSLKIPFTDIGLSGTWEPDESERTAAWEMYVELVTRVAVVELRPDEGLAREALSSLYTLFDTTRTILRAHGPRVAQAKGADGLSFGYLAVFIFNQLLRPFLARWHPLLLDYEGAKPQDVSPGEYERRWDKSAQLRAELAAVRGTLAQYADILAKVAGVPPLTTPPANG